MGFYSDMGEMARDLLKPDSNGGLGQGTIDLEHVTQGAGDPSKPWLPAPEVVEVERLDGAARGIAQDLVGTEAGGTVLLPSDLIVIATPPKKPYKVGDRLLVDGAPVAILKYEKVPAMGETVIVRFTVRG